MPRAGDHLVLRVLGPLEVLFGGKPVPLPPSKKTRALLAYLAVTRRPHRRNRLCEMFWDVPDDPRGALRWSVSKLRATVDRGGRRIRADRDEVAFEPDGATVDAYEVQAAIDAGIEALSVDRLRALVAAFRGPFLEGLELTEFFEFQAWCLAQREQWRSLQVRLLRTLVHRLEAAPAEAIGPARELVHIAPDEEPAWAMLVHLLFALDRRAEAEEHYRLGLRQIELACRTGTGELVATWDRLTSATTPAAAPAAEPFETRAPATQVVRFCTAPDGVHIAYATVGNGPPLVKTANWMSHLEHDWKSPIWRHLMRDLGSDRSLVRYDQRGNGLSDWEVDDFSLAAQVGDLEAVVDACRLDRFPVLGISHGVRVAIAYAVRHPERVTHLVLYGGSARGWRLGSRERAERRAGLMTLIRQGWGLDNPAFRQVFTTLFMPDATAEQVTWFNELQRVSTSPENALRINEATGNANVEPLLGRIRAPTLVLHATQEAVVPFDDGRALAAGIPGARFVALESRNHLLLGNEPAWTRLVTELRAFLAG